MLSLAVSFLLSSPLQRKKYLKKMRSILDMLRLILSTRRKWPTTSKLFMFTMCLHLFYPPEENGQLPASYMKIFHNNIGTIYLFLGISSRKINSKLNSLKCELNFWFRVEWECFPCKGQNRTYFFLFSIFTISSTISWKQEMKIETNQTLINL